MANFWEFFDFDLWEFSEFSFTVQILYLDFFMAILWASTWLLSWHRIWRGSESPIIYWTCCFFFWAVQTLYLLFVAHDCELKLLPSHLNEHLLATDLLNSPTEPASSSITLLEGLNFIIFVDQKSLEIKVMVLFSWSNAQKEQLLGFCLSICLEHRDYFLYGSQPLCKNLYLFYLRKVSENLFQVYFCPFSFNFLFSTLSKVIRKEAPFLMIWCTVFYTLILCIFWVDAIICLLFDWHCSFFCVNQLNSCLTMCEADI